MNDDIWSDLRAHWTESKKRERPERLSWAEPEMAEIHRLTVRLRDAGWRNIVYCPKGEELFLAWDPTDDAPYLCRYHGTWPKGHWIAYVDGDGWPAHPVLWKPLST